MSGRNIEVRELGKRERKTERQTETDRQTETERGRDRNRDRQRGVHVCCQVCQ